MIERSESRRVERNLRAFEREQEAQVLRQILLAAEDAEERRRAVQ
ncbi:MAG: hypothetical protein WEA10_06795 [Actinomycetota bacterium]